MREPSISAILLAAGLSTRMGGPNKMLLPFQETIVIQHTYNQLSNCGVKEVIVVGGEGFDDLKAVLRLRESDCLVQNSNYINGMTSSIKEGVANATGDAFIICLGDMPQLNTECYSSMVEAYMATYSRNAKAIMSPVVNGVRGNPVIFSGAHKKEIMENASRLNKGAI